MLPVRFTECPDPAGWSLRIARHSAPTLDGCATWTGVLDRHGYGKFVVKAGGRARQTGAHRAAWLAARGPIEGGLVIDHLCRNRACVNVEHMELVSNRVNTLRGDHSAKKGRSGKRREAPLHSCGKHGRTNGYIHTPPDGYARWICRECVRLRSAARRARQRAAGAQ